VTALVPRITRRIPFWRGQLPAPGPGPRRGGDGGGPGLCGLVFLFLADDQRADGSAPWRRGRSVLLELDARLAATHGIGYRVRALPGKDGSPLREPRQAGRLSRRRLRRPADGLDFPRALASARAALQRDVAALRLAGAVVTRPVVVFYAVTPPLADAITAEEYGRLAREALVTWVVPESPAPLMPPAFDVAGTRILTDHYAVADEVAHLIRAGTRGCHVP
jgi:hypothetical protein